MERTCLPIVYCLLCSNYKYQIRVDVVNYFYNIIYLYITGRYEFETFSKISGTSTHQPKKSAISSPYLGYQLAETNNKKVCNFPVIPSYNVSNFNQKVLINLVYRLTDVCASMTSCTIFSPTSKI